MITVLEGDCRKLLKLIPDESVDLILTDPPYGKDYQSQRPKSGNRKAKIEGDQNLDDAIKLLEDCAPEFLRILRRDAHLYVFCDPLLAQRIAFAFTRHLLQKDRARRTIFVWRNTVVWAKGRGMGDRTGQSYVHAYDTALFLTKGNRKLKGHPSDLIWVGRTVKHGAVHPTQKDIYGLAQLIEASSEPGELVLDPFAGSGSTGSAAIRGCEQPRRVILIEQDPKLADICRRRMEVHGEVKTEIGKLKATPLMSPRKQGETR